MRTFILILLLKTTLLAQKNQSIDLVYGYKTFLNDFNNQLNTINNFSFNDPVSTIGFTLPNGLYLNTAFLNKIYLELDIKLSYNQIIPKIIRIQDTINCSLNGFYATSNFGVDIFRKKKKFHLIAIIGLDVGRLKIYNNDFINQTNPFIAPKIGLQPKLKFSKVLLTMSLEYSQDLSNFSWTKKGSHNDVITLNKLNQSGIVTTIGVGYCFN
ncbi:MAG: hypothetical protein ACK50A_04965 [Sphingobacteriaceae bacterium]